MKMHPVASAVQQTIATKRMLVIMELAPVSNANLFQRGTS